MQLQENHPPVTIHDLERAEMPGYVDRVHEIGAVALWLDLNDPQPECGEEAVILELQHEIRKRLAFDHHGMPWNSKESGNCYSFAWHTSLALEEIGYEHYLAFTNGHAYILVVGKNKDVYMVNTDQPAMNDFEITRTTIPPNALQEMTEGFSGAAIATNLSTQQLKAKQEHDYAVRRRQHKPLYVYEWIKADAPTTTIMKPEAGREALYDYTNFTTSINTQDIGLMQHSLDKLQYCNPQQETRERLNEDITKFKRAINQFVANGVDVHEVVSLVDAYCSAMPDTLSMSIHRGDLYRIVAGAAHVDPPSRLQLATEAKRSYIASIHPTAGIDQMRQGKIAKCLALIKQATQALQAENVYA